MYTVSRDSYVKQNTLLGYAGLCSLAITVGVWYNVYFIKVTHPMDTPLELKGGKKWLPIRIFVMERHLEQLIVPVTDFDVEKCIALKKNVAYSLQHLEFLHRCECDLATTSVVSRQNAKTFIIVACGILEALFFYILGSSGKAAKTDWKSVSKATTSECEIGGKKLRSEIEYFEKLDEPILQQMTFDAMCKRVEKRDLAKLRSEEFYKHLPYLRSLRNRVHIHDVNGMADTDWVKFNTGNVNLVKQVLSLLLQSSFFPIKNEDHFYFLNV